MKFIKTGYFIPLKVKHNILNHIHRLNFSTTGEEIYKDLLEIWKKGKPPSKFNFARDIFDRHVTSRPSSTALWIDNDHNPERKWTFSELQKESIRSAVFLRNALKLPNTLDPPEKSPFILTVLPRIPEWWFLYLASIRIGSVFCPGTTMLTSEDIQYRLEASAASMIITDEDNLPKVEEAYQSLEDRVVLENLKKVVVTGKSEIVKNLPKGWIDYHSTISRDITHAEEMAFKNSDTRSNDIAQGFFTSGTTGKPKMVAHTHVSYGIGQYTTAKGLQLKESDVMWNISDPGWAKSSYSNFFAPWIAGSAVYIHQMPRFEPKKVLKVLTEKPITNLCAPPTLYKNMIQEQDESLFKFKSLHFSIGAGEPVSPEVSKVWKERSGIQLYEMYGQTEMTGVDFQTSEKPGSVGIPNGFYDLRILDENGNQCPPNIEGQIALKVNPSRPIGLFKGYLKAGVNGPEMDDEKNAISFVGDYYLTGDQAFKDESGHLYFVGRSDDVISSSGYRIGPSEIESVLQTHPAVVESAAVASPDAARGEVVKAFIILAQSYKDADANKLTIEIQDYVKKKTAPYKYPRKIEFVETLPKTISGKILRRELKRMEYQSKN